MDISKKQILLGFLIGITSTFIISFLTFINTNPGLSISEYFNIFIYGKLISPILSIALMGNLGLFFLFLKLNKDFISRGILIATVFVGIIIFCIKIFI